MALNIKSLQDLLGLNKKQVKAKAGSTSQTATFDRNAQNGVVPVPLYQDHLVDLFTDRQNDDSRLLLTSLFRNDPDISAAVNSYLTLANTEMVVYVKDPATQQISREATDTLTALITGLFEPFDYSRGFQLKPDLATTCEELRYMTLLRGGVAAELIFDKNLVPDRFQIVDMGNIRWREKEAGIYKPYQLDRQNNEIELDFPTFFVAFHRRDPNVIYPYSTFVSSINTIAARQLVINELYSIMRQTGYPRMDIKVIEETMIRNAPAPIRSDPPRLQQWLNDRLTAIGTTITNLRSGQPFVHWDSIEAGTSNERNPASGIDIRPVIEVLNAQNQAALKAMPTVLGRGTGNASNASVEARYAAMCADELNKPLAAVLRRSFQFLLNINGVPGFVEVYFLPAELRPDLELEPQRVMRASRLKDDLSLGLITDEEYHLWVHNRMPPPDAEPIAGTGFMDNGPKADVSAISPNSDPLGRSVSGAGADSVRSNENKNSDGGRAVE